MAYYNYPQRKNNSKFTGMGVGPHDYVTYTYDGSGNVTDIYYYLGGQQASGTLVGHIRYTYDGSGNITTSERIA
jgi:hypothetical protein